MFTCAQLDDKGVCRTVARLSSELIGDRIIPLNTEADVLGLKYASGRFYDLVAAPQTKSIPAGQPVVIDVSWVDQGGNLVDDPDLVTAACNGTETGVVMTGGHGTVEFVADAPGVYPIRVSAACGIVVDVEVTVE